MFIFDPMNDATAKTNQLKLEIQQQLIQNDLFCANFRRLTVAILFFQRVYFVQMFNGPKCYGYALDAYSGN